VPDDKVAIPLVSVWRAVAFGLRAGLLAAAAFAAFTILTGFAVVPVFSVFGALVAFAVEYGADSPSRRWVQVLAIFLTLVSLVAAEYPIALHFGYSTGSPGWLSPSYIADNVSEDLQTNPLILLFWGIALFTAWSMTREDDDDDGDVSPSGVAEDDGTNIGWAPWLVASTALVVGAASLLILARVPIGATRPPIEATGRDRPSIPQHADHPISVPMETVKVGDCFNFSSGDTFDSLPELPCGQPHHSEVFYLYSMNAGTYPGDDQVQASATERCGRQLTSYAKQEDIGLLSADGFAPDSGSWHAGDRTVICFLYRDDEAKLASSERGPH
jgi:hypothetical protein